MNGNSKTGRSSPHVGQELSQFGNVMEEITRAPERQRLWSPAFATGVVIIAIGIVLVVIRMIFGLGSITNLSDGFPWGIWIAFDVVVGIALAAGGFVTAAMVYILNLGRYGPLVRPALLTALIGYGMAAFAVFIDVGRWWQLYNPIFPENWHASSALFEVCICVMSYLLVLLVEFIPTVTEKWLQGPDGMRKSLAGVVRPLLEKMLIVFILLGVVISCLHQSSLGSIMLLMSHRLHALWYTPWLPLLFLLSAIAVGMHVVIVESIISARSFGRRIEFTLLSGIAKRSIVILGLYVIVKIWDLLAYNELHLIFDGWFGVLFLAEVSLFGIIPGLLLSFKAFRRDPRRLFWISWMVIAGLVLNRFNVYLFAVESYDGWSYFPTIWEIIVSAMMVSVVFVAYKVLANYYPVLHSQREVGTTK